MGDFGRWVPIECRYCDREIGQYRTDWTARYYAERVRRSEDEHFAVCWAKALVDLRDASGGANG